MFSISLEASGRNSRFSTRREDFWILWLILVLMTAVNCGVSAVAVHRRRRHLCHGALADSHFLEFLQLQYIDTVIDDCCAAPAVWVQMWRSRSSSHSCNVDAGHVAHMPVVASIGAWDGRDSAVHCGGSAVGTHRLACFLGPCTQVQGRGSCPQGHGPQN